jgi:hypothetical protein
MHKLPDIAGLILFTGIIIFACIAGSILFLGIILITLSDQS